jgi:DNA-binding response OmpR family regulator
VPHVLLVDDDRALLEALRQLLPLRLPGLVVDTAITFTAALEQLRRTAYDVVALGSIVAGTSGRDLLAQVRTLRPDTAVVLFSGQTDRDWAAQGPGAAFEVIPKPIDWDALSAVIDRAIRNRHTSRSPDEPPCTPTPARAAPGMSESAPPGAARRVLIIEDDADGREMLRLLLQIWGHQVEVAADGLQGIQKSCAGRFDVILIDIGLPGMDGYQVARQLRNAPGGRDLVLIALTGHGQPEDRRRALAAGFDEHFTKPVDPQELAEKLLLF